MPVRFSIDWLSDYIDSTRHAQSDEDDLSALTIVRIGIDCQARGIVLASGQISLTGLFYRGPLWREGGARSKNRWEQRRDPVYF